MRKILITGGPVHAHIDDVKIVTNRFRGGLMQSLAETLACNYDCQITYLTAPKMASVDTQLTVDVVYHNGFFDYREKVLSLAKDHTDVILGAAVANLIPANPIKGKFPSHNYNEGDIVSLDFLVTPRVITQVKAAAPHVNLIGFKLLSGAPHEELLRAAWHTLRDSRAAAVIANDAKDLQTKYICTKEGAVHPLPNSELAAFLWELMNEEHYRTEVLPVPFGTASTQQQLVALIDHWRSTYPGLFVTTDDGLVFGTLAARDPSGGFWTTGRGKRELSETVYVREVNHVTRTVQASGSKASLNAPLLDNIFKSVPQAQVIVHGHVQDATLPTLPYAQPGTVRDSQRPLAVSFNVDKHGCFYVLDQHGEIIRSSKS